MANKSGSEIPTMTLQNQNRQHTVHKTPPATWLCLDFDTVDYGAALDLQHRLVDARKSKVLETDILLVLEHPPVFTLGRRGGRENLRVSSDFLETMRDSIDSSQANPASSSASMGSTKGSPVCLISNGLRCQ